ncbi:MULTISPECIES: NAD(P)H-dependent oxidoreductase [Bacillus]|uniref:NAD(P)H-dependent oxidoreductase n=1 Tax=Bacillus sp. 8A6 TaxID=2201170 RepID=UPI000DCDE513|nr:MULTISPECIES: NAD(P)H-dependent oxidoreductase [Bacillus]MCY7470801.1 NAD(P)H-dependent oxidoreductase [Bacillus safensis]NWF40415.1 NAD(P)H dehydrogenase [Bacillus sp. 8A6]RAU59261.1 flavodoxin family protein [Bacillus safensis]USY28209.1 NAD(P)H-dependent oxidoreductase [Bacillus safensis]GLF81425.1 NAD(P)H dehydrogenase (quinone) [Bacillus safensis]
MYSIIYTHPHHNSLNGAFLKEIVRGSEENPIVQEVKIIDLYQEKFNPVLVFNEEKKRRDMHKDPDIRVYQDKIKWADKIVFVYPIWWGRPPAMLLGFIDRMFAANFAYRQTGGLLPEGLLKGKSAVCVSTMQGPANYPLFFLQNAHKMLMKRALLQYVGIKSVKFSEFGMMESAKGRHDIKLKRTYNYFRNISC